MTRRLPLLAQRMRSLCQGMCPRGSGSAPEGDPWKAVSHSSFQQKSALFFFNTWKNGLHLFVDRLMNLLRAARRPFSIWTFFTQVGDLMFRIADIWSESASILRRVPYIQEVPRSHPKCALFRVEFHLILPKEIEGFV